MDILTQAVLGAAVAQSVAKKTELRVATFIGLVAGILADADVFIYSSNDPLLTLEYHRHFSHSIFFIPIGALLAAGLLWFFVKNHLSFKRLYIFSLAGYSLSGFIDACTSYGTYLFWPLLDQRLSFNIISIVDPIFTTLLVVFIISAWLKWRPQLAQLALVLCTLYLLTGLAQNYRADQWAKEIIQQRQHQAEKVLVKPSFANIFLWRIIYLTEDKIVADAVYLGLTPKLYPGGSIKMLDVDKDLPNLAKESVLYSDINRFKQLSSGYLAMSPVNDNVLGDMRYSMLPNSLNPIWGITINSDKPEQHASYGFYRENTAEIRNQFKQMLLGREIH